MGGEEARAAGDAEHAKRADERRHPQARDQEAVDHARDQGHQECRQQAAQQCDLGRQARQRLHDPGHDHRAQAHDVADREVDAAGDDDERLAEPEQERRRREHGDALDVEPVEQERDAVGRARPALEEDHERRQEQPGPGRRQKAQPRVLLLVRLARRRAYRHDAAPGPPAPPPPIGMPATIAPPDPSQTLRTIGARASPGQAPIGRGAGSLRRTHPPRFQIDRSASQRAGPMASDLRNKADGPRRRC